MRKGLLLGFVKYGWMVCSLVIGFLAFSYSMVITSDIPVSFTKKEALFSQSFYFVATLMLVISLLLLKGNVERFVAVFIFLITTGFQFPMIRVDSLLHSTNDPAVSQLLYTGLLHSALLLGMSIFLIIKKWNRE